MQAARLTRPTRNVRLAYASFAVGGSISGSRSVHNAAEHSDQSARPLVMTSSAVHGSGAPLYADRVGRLGEPAVPEGSVRGMTILGCTCTGNAAYFALMSGDNFVEDPLSRIPIADVLTKGERLIELRESVRVELERIRPNGIALLGSIARPRSYNEAAERATVEAIVRIAAQELGLRCERIAPPTVAARLGLGRTGPFEAKVRAFFREEHPPYWAERCKAAAVAVAWQRA